MENRFKFFWIGAIAVAMVGCGKREVAAAEKPYVVDTGDVSVTVVESGTVDAIKVVELKPLATGRLAKLMVDEGSPVIAGQLVALIDPQETQLRVDQNRAQLMGAQSQVDRNSIEIGQRRRTAAAAVTQADARVKQLELEIQNQPALLKAEIDQAEANFASAKQELDRLSKSAQPTQRASVKAQLDEADENLRNAKFEFDRQKELEAKGFVSTRSLQTAELNLEVSKARYRNVKEQLDKLDAGLRAEFGRAEENVKTAKAQLARAKANLFQLGTRKEDLRSAKAELERARAGLADPAVLEKQKLQGQASVIQLQSQLKDSERLLRETEVRSPITGIVSKRVLQVGELATGLSTFGSGSTILKIEDRTKMRIKLAVNEIDVARLQLGMPASVVIDALSGQKFTGKVSKIAPTKQEVAGQSSVVGSDTVVKFEVEIVLDNVNGALKSGMSAKCTMDVASRKNVVVLPAEYVEKSGEDYFVRFPPKNPKDPKDKGERKKIKIGLKSNSRYEVLEGVAKGNQIIKPDFSGPQRKGFMQMGRDEEEGG